ncbi:hypothetical protein SAMN05216382_0589 [Sphingomonas palmae]|uniref:Uncharacterized protein n=1 Tax=Sphingomonas palmae TaxID=1855283 RepID=A0A1H7HSA8_9SPHN|nr:hypothetical protein [Sphingomonas palmae]SEK53139.1 hypothetical protein SAMN05216382_0589 [Sphingomonas palmae]
MRKGRNIPAMIVAVLGGVLVSMLAGLLLASYAVAGVSPSYLPEPALHQTRIAQESASLPEPTTIQRIAADVDAAQVGRREL